MTRIHKVSAWAGAILLVALGNAYGVIDDGSANTMFAVLPALAVISLRGANCGCLFSRAEG